MLYYIIVFPNHFARRSNYFSEQNKPILHRIESSAPSVVFSRSLRETLTPLWGKHEQGLGPNYWGVRLLIARRLLLPVNCSLSVIKLILRVERTGPAPGRGSLSSVQRVYPFIWKRSFPWGFSATLLFLMPRVHSGQTFPRRFIPNTWRSNRWGIHVAHTTFIIIICSITRMFGLLCINQRGSDGQTPSVSTWVRKLAWYNRTFIVVLRLGWKICVFL